MKKTIRDYDINNKKILIRCDFNVPIKDGMIVDDNRIITSLPTINYAIENNAKIILFSHLGRVKTEDDKMQNSLKIVANRLSELLNREVLFISETRGKLLEEAINNMKNGDIILVENTRFEDLNGKKESGNDIELGKYWASLGDIFINDAFGTIHRAHASNAGIASFIDSGIGFLVEKELKELSVFNDPVHPFIVILGGSKVEDKISMMENLVKKADYILIGGGMAYTFLKAKGINVGMSKLDSDSLDFAKEMLDNYFDKIILPTDVIVFSEFDNNCCIGPVDVDLISDNVMGLDIGPKTIDNFSSYLSKSKLVFWNGPVGVYEFDNCINGTKKLLEVLVNSSTNCVLGGGDVVAAASKLGYKDKVTHASTGGGATLEYMEGKELPGLKVIINK